MITLQWLYYFFCSSNMPTRSVISREASEYVLEWLCQKKGLAIKVHECTVIISAAAVYRCTVGIPLNSRCMGTGQSPIMHISCTVLSFASHANLKRSSGHAQETTGEN